MVKGIARRVVLVKSPDPKLFDEAIFIVRDESGRSPGVTTEQLLLEARDVAESFVRSQRSPSQPALFSLPWWAYSALGAAATGLVWLSTVIF